MEKDSHRNLTVFFIPCKHGDHKNMKENQIPKWLFEGRASKGKNKLPDGLDWPCYKVAAQKATVGIEFL